jgi:hypothetical protein
MDEWMVMDGYKANMGSLVALTNTSIGVVF